LLSIELNLTLDLVILCRSIFPPCDKFRFDMSFWTIMSVWGQLIAKQPNVLFARGLQNDRAHKARTTKVLCSVTMFRNKHFIFFMLVFWYVLMCSYTFKFSSVWWPSLFFFCRLRIWKVYWISQYFKIFIYFWILGKVRMILSEFILVLRECTT
jgi:hypothetical protein